MTPLTDPAHLAFVAWTKAHPSKWNLGRMVNSGKLVNFTDPDTDTAWLGFEAAWKLRPDIDSIRAKHADFRQTFCMASPGSEKEFTTWLDGYDTALIVIAGP